jgi:hypothetical protein
MRPLSKSIQKKLALYLLAMLLLNGSILMRTRQLIPEGLPDFTIFYTAAHIVHSGQGARLYDDHLQGNFQASFSPRGTELRGSLLPYNHPPFEALLFVPLAGFSYLDAYLIWLAINIVLVCALPFLLRPCLRNLQSISPWLWLLAGFSFFPIFVSLIKGQDSVLLLFLYSLAFMASCRERQQSGGFWIAIGLFKYNLVLPYVLLFIRRNRFVTMFAATAVLLILISALITGWAGLLDYPRYVWSAEHNPHFVWNNSDGNTPNLRGMISSLLPLGPAIRQVVTIVASLAILLLAGKVTMKAKAFNPIGFAVALLAAELVSYHAFVHDLSLLYLPILIALNRVAAPQKVAPGLRKTLIFCSLIFFCSPIYMVLMLRFGQLQLVTLVILIFFFTLLKFSPSTATAPAPA